MFQRTRVLLGGLVWKQKRFNQLRKRRAREYQNRVMEVEVSISRTFVIDGYSVLGSCCCCCWNDNAHGIICCGLLFGNELNIIIGNTS